MQKALEIICNGKAVCTYPNSNEHILDYGLYSIIKSLQFLLK